MEQSEITNRIYEQYQGVQDENKYETLKNAAELFASCMNDNLYVCDMEHDVYYISRKAMERFNLPSNEFPEIIKNHRLFVHPDDFQLLSHDLEMVANGEKDTHNLQYRWLGKDLEPIWINCQGRAILNSEGKTILMIGCINEIGKKQKADNISGLLGEIPFREQLSQFRDKPECYILRFGIDDFKKINESLGLEYGNRVLKDVAECIKECIQPGQFVYRMEADEYIVFDLLSKNQKAVKQLYLDIRHKIDEHIENGGYEALYTVSCGAVSHKDLTKLDFEQITKYTKFALSCAKNSGKNKLYHFHEGEYQTFLSNRKMARNLRKAVSKDYDGFELFFQPIVYAETGEIYAAEALLRYRNDAGELISPFRFIPSLEESGLIIPVGRWVIDTALAACVECQTYKPNFKISINLSYVQLLKSSLYNDLISLIEKHGISPESIIVEMTESGYWDHEETVRKVWKKLREYGVQIAIDDFGTGYSNFINISKMQPDILKIDREFTVKALHNEYDHRLLTQILDLVHSLDIREVIEGVEEKDELDHMVSLGADYIQGYYFSEPRPLSEFMEKFIR